MDSVEVFDKRILPLIVADIVMHVTDVTVEERQLLFQLLIHDIRQDALMELYTYAEICHDIIDIFQE